MTARAGLLALLLCAPVAARAQPTDGVASLGARVRQRAVEAVDECERGALIIRVSEELPDDAPDADGLVAQLIAPTVAALGADARFDPVHVGAFGRDDAHPAALASRLGYATLLDLVVRREGGHLVLEIEGFATQTAERRARYVVRQRLGVELRRYAGFPPEVTAETVDARFAVMPGRGYVALAAADLNGDGRVEIVVVEADGVRVLRLREGRLRHRLEVVGRAEWPADVAPTPVPRRRTLASARARGRAVILRHSDLAAPVEVTWTGGAVTTRRANGPCADDRYPVRGGCAQLVDGRDFFDDVLEVEGEAHETPMHFYAYAAGRFAVRAGGHSHLEALVNPAGRLVMRMQEEPADGEAVPHTAGAVGYGTALAMTDLDLDGAAELLLSHAASAGAGDQLSLLRAHPRGALRVVWRSEVLPGSVWTAAEGDVDNDGLDELIAIEEPQNPDRGRARLWVVQ